MERDRRHDARRHHRAQHPDREFADALPRHRHHRHLAEWQAWGARSSCRCWLPRPTALRAAFPQMAPFACAHRSTRRRRSTLTARRPSFPRGAGGHSLVGAPCTATARSLRAIETHRPVVVIVRRRRCVAGRSHILAGAWIVTQAKRHGPGDGTALRGGGTRRASTSMRGTRSARGRASLAETLQRC